MQSPKTLEFGLGGDPSSPANVSAPGSQPLTKRSYGSAANYAEGTLRKKHKPYRWSPHGLGVHRICRESGPGRSEATLWSITAPIKRSPRRRIIVSRQLGKATVNSRSGFQKRRPLGDAMETAVAFLMCQGNRAAIWKLCEYFVLVQETSYEGR